MALPSWAISYGRNYHGPSATRTNTRGIKIGLSKAEVKYIKGIPQAVIGDWAKAPGPWNEFRELIDVKKIPDGKTVDDYNSWQYNFYEGNLTIDFDQNVVTTVDCYSSDKLGRCSPILSLIDGDSEEKVVSRLGKPEDSKLDGVVKKLSYDKLGIHFLLEQKKVYMVRHQ